MLALRNRPAALDRYVRCEESLIIMHVGEPRFEKLFCLEYLYSECAASAKLIKFKVAREVNIDICLESVLYIQIILRAYN